MKEWKEYLIKVNGFKMNAVYNEETIREVFLPLLKHLHELQKQKNERLIVFMAALKSAIFLCYKKDGTSDP